jgi:hypothetical protein
MTIVHVTLLSLLVLGALAVITTGVRPPTAMLFGLVVLLTAVEAWAALRLIERFLTNESRQ